MAETTRSTWRKFGERVRERWDRITAKELDEVEGNLEELIALIRRRYRTARAEIESEIRSLRRRAASVRSPRTRRPSAR